MSLISELDPHNHFLKLFNNVDDLNSKLSTFPKTKKIVYTYGAWDLVHPGHLKFLLRARSLGDFLVVGIISDKQIRSFKGEERPLQPQSDRSLIVSSFSFVDAAICQEIYDPSEILRSLYRVDILTKGDDWDYIPGQETINELGGDLVKLNYSDGFSTTSLVNKIKKD
tara:strand:+ start:193 stop:696 length:504 start_codon:yes stop_codon:yes gene_type:complete